MKDTASLKRHQVIFDPGNERTKHNKLAKPKFSENINKEKKKKKKEKTEKEERSIIQKKKKSCNLTRKKTEAGRRRRLRGD